VGLVSPFAVEGAEPVGVITRMLRFNHVLFERKSKSFEFVGHGTVKVSSEQTTQVTWDAIHGYIASLPVHGAEIGHRIQVYEVWELTFLFGVRLMLVAHRSVRGSIQ